MDAAFVTAFAVFALVSQAGLAAYFAARRWRPSWADRYGIAVYALGAAGVAVGGWLWVSGASWQVVAGPLLYAVWTAFGAWADRFARIEWRRPVRWQVFGPYVLLYLATQMFLWWPMWDLWRPGWGAFLVLFVLNTGLNLAGHVPALRSPRPA